LRRFYLVRHKIGAVNRNDFQDLARTRIREAQALFGSGEYSGAYYLIGYAVECALESLHRKEGKAA